MRPENNGIRTLTAQPGIPDVVRKCLNTMSAEVKKKKMLKRLALIISQSELLFVIIVAEPGNDRKNDHAIHNKSALRCSDGDNLLFRIGSESLRLEVSEICLWP